MIHLARRLACKALLATPLLAAPAFAQPGAQPDDPPPVAAGTVVIVAPAPAMAQPPQPLPPPPPQNQPWSNVSHINGQLVKVGEQGDYLYDNGKRINVASNPIGWMFGFYGLSVSVAVHGNVALRGDVNLFRLHGQHGHELGISAPIYFRRTFQGPFLEPGLVTRNFNDNCGGCDGSYGPQVLFGWQWSFDSGFNVAMALGAMRDMHNGDDDPEPVGYFRIGYAL